MAVIDDFRNVQLAAGGKVRTEKTNGKGHADEVVAFAEALKSGGAWPIPWTELHAVSLASILAVQSLHEGLPIELSAATGA